MSHLSNSYAYNDAAAVSNYCTWNGNTDKSTFSSPQRGKWMQPWLGAVLSELTSEFAAGPDELLKAALVDLL